MTKALQFHMLTSFPPSCSNRDDTNRHKSCKFGNEGRLRISSQSLKAAMRRSLGSATNPAFDLSRRTKRLFVPIEEQLIAEGATPEQARAATNAVLPVFGVFCDKAKADVLGKVPASAALVFASRREEEALLQICREVVEGSLDEKEALKRAKKEAVGMCEEAGDIALFGRMIASSLEHNVDAALSISHAITTHGSFAETDFWTGMDDLVPADRNTAAMMNHNYFGSGVFYTYICVDLEQLYENLGRDKAAVRSLLPELVRCIATVRPGGMVNSFAHNPLAGYIEMTYGAPFAHNLANAFATGVEGTTLMETSIAVLREERDRYEACYGNAPEQRHIMDAPAGEGTLAELQQAAAALADKL